MSDTLECWDLAVCSALQMVLPVAGGEQQGLQGWCRGAERAQIRSLWLRKLPLRG